MNLKNKKCPSCLWGHFISRGRDSTMKKPGIIVFSECYECDVCNSILMIPIEKKRAWKNAKGEVQWIKK